MTFDIDKILYEMNDQKSKRIFEKRDYMNLLSQIHLLSNKEEIISIDEYHRYRNDSEYIYGYNIEDGAVYKMKKHEQKAELIDCFSAISKIK